MKKAEKYQNMLDEHVNKLFKLENWYTYGRNHKSSCNVFSLNLDQLGKIHPFCSKDIHLLDEYHLHKLLQVGIIINIVKLF